MAEYLIQDTTLTGLADKIRILSGTEDTMTPAVMDTKLGGANTEVDTQTDLIAQIAAALEGKTLPDGGGASVETCTVTIEDLSGNAYWDCMHATVFENGVINTFYSDTSDIGTGASITLENVVKNSIIVINMNDGYSPNSFTGGVVLLDTYAEHGDYASTIVIQITDNATIPLNLMIPEN